MISNEEIQKVEKCTVQIECINILQKDDIEFGTGFLIGKNIVITASHVISKYYDDSSNCLINIIPIKAGISKKIPVKKVLGNESNKYISLLEIEDELDIVPLKFTLGYEIKRGDEYFTFGYPRVKRMYRGQLNNKISTNINISQSRKVDWELNLSTERVEEYEGLSGAPVIINNNLVGIVQTESTANGKTISLAMSSIDMIKEYIPNKYYEKYSEIFDIKKLIDTNEKRVYSIEDINRRLKESTKLSTGLDFFEIDDDDFKKKFSQSLDSNVYVVGKAREETLYCILNELKYNTLL